MRALELHVVFSICLFFQLVKNNDACRPNTYALNSTFCAPCPPNTVSPADSEVVTECTPKPGYYGWPGQTAVECGWNEYCPQGVTRPAPCPPGTRSDPGVSICVIGSKNVILYDWVTGVTWISLFLVVLVFVSCYNEVLFANELGGNARRINIKIER